MHIVHPPKFYITIVFDFSWDNCSIQEKLETMVMQFVFGGTGWGGGGGVRKVHYGLCEHGKFITHNS